MTIKLVTWDDSKTKREMQKRLRNSQDARVQHEDKWIRNENSIYNTYNGMNSTAIQGSLEVNFNTGMPPVNGSDAESNTSYTFKNFRYIHAQLSSNPPSVVMRPQTSDQDDHRKADAADRVVRYAIRHYQMQEQIDQLSLQTLLYGTGAIKTVWDSGKGSIMGYDEQTDDLLLEGDIDVTVPNIWNMFVDPDAKNMNDIKWVIERIFIDYEEALACWPDKEDLLKQSKVEKEISRIGGHQTSGRESQLQDDHYNSVELFEYWETGLPTNGYLGRYTLVTKNGDVIESCRPSPHKFKKAGGVSKIEESDLPEDVKEKLIQKLPEQACLPYHFFTDIDVPNTFWGKSMVEYAAQGQNNLNALDSARIDNMKAHGVARLVIPESADVPDDGLSNSPWDVTKISGNQPPYFMAPPQLMPDMTAARQDIITGINDVMGTNESMFGQQSREQAASAMQYATNQGNMIRRRLFNKFVLVTESVYGNGILNLVRKHWVTSRMIHVLGKEKALEAIDLKGTDIDGGYNVVGEYGATLSLDPITRRQEIITMQPLFEKAGVPPRTALKMMKLSELEGMYDKLDMAGNRQKEIFDLMIATQQYIPPKKYRDHENMVEWAYDYFMTSEYEMLSEEVQLLCEQHIQERIQLAAQEKSGAGAAGAGGAAPAGSVAAGSTTAAAPIAPGGLPSSVAGATSPAVPSPAPSSDTNLAAPGSP